MAMSAAGTNTSSSNIYGVAVGADYRFSRDTVAGFALAGGGTNYSVVNGGTGTFGYVPARRVRASQYRRDVSDGIRRLRLAGCEDGSLCDRRGRRSSPRRTSTPTPTRAASNWVIASCSRGSAGSVSRLTRLSRSTAFELPAYAEQAVTGANTFALSLRREHIDRDAQRTGPAHRQILRARWCSADAARPRRLGARLQSEQRGVGATFQTLPGASFVVNGAALAPDAALTTASAEAELDQRLVRRRHVRR